MVASPPRAPKLIVLDTGDPVALTIDSNDWPYRVLSIRGVASVKQVNGVPAEYAAAARRYMGDEQGGAMVDSVPVDVVTYRIAVTPTWANILDFETRFPSAFPG